MRNFFKLFRRKPRIIPFNAYRPPEAMSKDELEILEKFRRLSEENRLKVIRAAKILSFKYHNGSLTSPGLASFAPTGKCKITSFEYRNFEHPEKWSNQL
jgi:hypothetical protein